MTMLELKLLAFKEELECTLSLAAKENWNHLQFLTRNCLERKAPGEGSVEEDRKDKILRDFHK